MSEPATIVAPPASEKSNVIRIYRLKEPRMQSEQHDIVTYVARPEFGTPFEEVLKPDYWSHVAYKLKPDFEIKVLPEGSTYYARLLVRDCGRNWAKVAVLERHDFDAIATTGDGEIPGYAVEHKGRGTHAIIRLKDRQQIGELYKTRLEAQAALVDLAKVLAR